jgi:DNA recombination protein RmuC
MILMFAVTATALAAVFFLVVIALAVGLLAVLVASGRSRAELASAPDITLREALAELELRSAHATSDAVQAAVAQVLDLNRAQLGQATEAHNAALCATQELSAQRLDLTLRATEAALAAQTQAARDDLAAREALIESRLAQVQGDLKGELAKVAERLASLQSSSADSLSRVSSQLAFHASSTKDLAATTGQLREALASTKSRGQWGERMAEDVLHMAGFVEHINYVKQTATADRTGIPDFTFLLPKGHKLFMDVKFPLTSYLRYLEADSDLERSVARKQFLSDVRMRVRELAKRDYADDAGALDDVLLFIPNETITSFIHESEPSLMDDAMRQHIVFCSPLTLFAMLGVIRQAYDNFMVEQQATEILGLVSKFKLQWGKYSDQIDKVDRSFQTVQKAFLDLNATRRNQLERVVNQIDGVRAERGIAAAPVEAFESVRQLELAREREAG